MAPPREFISFFSNNEWDVFPFLLRATATHFHTGKLSSELARMESTFPRAAFMGCCRRGDNALFVLRNCRNDENRDKSLISEFGNPMKEWKRVGKRFMNEKAFPEAVLVFVSQSDGENFPFSADIFLFWTEISTFNTCFASLRQLTAAFGAKSRFADVDEHDSNLFFIAICCGLPRWASDERGEDGRKQKLRCKHFENYANSRSLSATIE